MHETDERLKKILCCPDCFGDLGWSNKEIYCSNCSIMYPIVDGRPVFFHSRVSSLEDAAFQQEQMFNSTFTARICSLGKKVVNSEYTPLDQLEKFLNTVSKDDLCLELGSGNRRLLPNTVNIDIFPFPNVDIVANIEKIPLPSNTVNYVVLDTVIEHVQQPQKVADEVHRILKTGGKAICISPFVFPYHGYPGHYCNFSKDGLEFLFRNFSKCSVSMNIGPTSALTNLVSEYFAILLGRSSFLYTVIKGLVLIPIFYLKFLDRFWIKSSKAHRMASTLCTILQK